MEQVISTQRGNGSIGEQIDSQLVSAKIKEIEKTVFVAVPYGRFSRDNSNTKVADSFSTGRSLRSQEFYSGRTAAQVALQQLLGRSDCVVPKGSHGEPCWPNGISGSITHSAGTAIAAVSFSSSHGGVGIDLEHISHSKYWQEILPLCALPDEQSWVLTANGNIPLRALALFSAKEAVFKALFPLARTYFEFHDLNLTWEKGFNGFSIKSIPKNYRLQYTSTSCSTIVHCEVGAHYIFTYFVSAWKGKSDCRLLEDLVDELPNLSIVCR